MAKDPASSIVLKNCKCPTYISCAQGKQKKNAQSRKDTGANLPIERVGGLIFSDLKYPMTPKGRLHNRYLVNFVDHKYNYCRVFLATTKAKAAKKFGIFLVFFERQFNWSIHVLCTDGGGEYSTSIYFVRGRASRDISSRSGTRRQTESLSACKRPCSTWRVA